MSRTATHPDRVPMARTVRVFDVDGWVLRDATAREGPELATVSPGEGQAMLWALGRLLNRNQNDNDERK